MTHFGSLGNLFSDSDAKNRTLVVQREP